MLPTIRERHLHAAPYAARTIDRDDDRRDWRYVPQPTYAYEDGGQAPLPPLRSTLSYRDEDAWRQRPPPPPSAPQSHVRPRLDLFAHLPLSSSASSSMRPPLRHNDGTMEDDDDGRYDPRNAPQMYRSHASSGALGHHQDSEYYQGNNAPSKRHSAGPASSAAAKRRSRRMSNSERGKLYRSRRKEYVETLEDQVEALKQQLEEMRVKNKNADASDRSAPSPRPASPYDTLVLSNDRSRAGLARIVCEYFSLFQYGVPVAPMNGSPSKGDSPTQQLTLSQSPRLVSFIETLMDPNMRFGDNFGVRMLLEQWQRYSAYHAALQFDLNSIEVVTSDTMPVLSATATLRVRFTRTTIEKVFPHILWNEALVQRLIGLDVEYPVGNKFYFGPDGKIKRYETEVDFVSAFVKALGNVRDAMQVVGNALIKEQHRIGDDDDVDRVDDNASPNGSASSRSSVHSQSTSPVITASERPRFKQSEARDTEQVADEDRSPPDRARQATQVYYEDRDAYRRPTSEPPYYRNGYDNGGHDYHHSYGRSSAREHTYDVAMDGDRRREAEQYN